MKSHEKSILIHPRFIDRKCSESVDETEPLMTDKSFGSGELLSGIHILSFNFQSLHGFTKMTSFTKIDSLLNM
jgi:hypothetical protein